MSRVFLADETALDRRVVIKVLPPEMAAGVNRDRFRREIQLAARLQHPHIVPLLSAGADDDLLWYVMPFIEGESLRVRLAKQGELPVRETVQMLREIADALSYAHDHGVVHRDIKPDNVLISGRHVLVTDFGVAKAVTESTGGQSLTSLGIALGTPAYMAPEQAAADPHVDHRADIYALGALAYEMLAGRPPFMGPSPQAVLAAHVTQAPEAVTGLRPSVPPALNALIMRCLEKRAADRWQRSDELFPHLEALLTPSGGMAPTGAVAAVSSGTGAARLRAHPIRVSLLFAVAAGLMLAAVWFVVRWLGLPDWVFIAAIVLAVTGFPIVLFASRHERRRAETRTTGTAHVTPRGPLAPFTTLRGAIRGGVVAFAGLGVAAAGFMGLRAAGVGPFATLVTSGFMSERDKLLVADFDNRSTDSTLGQSVTEALRIDLARSTVVRLLEREDVTSALRRMERNPETPLAADVAREVAEREGAKAVVTGEIAPLGAGFVLSARLLAVGDGRTLLAERETATDAGGLIAAVDRLSRKLREGIGESLRSIRAGEPLESVTTTSLDALRHYTQSERAADAARYEQSAALLEQALALDSTFAMAWRKLGVVLANQGGSRSREIDAVTRAYQLRDRLPERERLIATAYYHGSVTSSIDAEISAYRQLLERWPDDPTALNNISIAYQSRRRYADAERAARRGTEVTPRVGVLWANRVSSQILQGRFSAADSSLERWREAAPEAGIRFESAYGLAFARGEFDGAWNWADSLSTAEPLTFRARAASMKARVRALAGRVTDAGRHYAEALELNRQRGSIQGFYVGAANWFSGDYWIRDNPERARRRMDSLLASHPIDSLAPTDRPYLPLANFYARMGDAARAEGHYRSWQQEVPRVVREGDIQRFATEGMIARGRARPADAIAAFRRVRELTGCGTCWLLEIGEAFEELGRLDSAMAAYEALATLPEDSPFSGLHFTLPPALRRLGELYEGQGNKDKAVEYYSKLLELWREADPELQPKVAEVKRRVAQLVGEPRG
jgi:tetratricopeptide (TPR) repeat protein